jgi:hypothetical protein
MVTDGVVLTETYERGTHRLTLISIDGTSIELAQWEHDPLQPVREHSLPTEWIGSGSYQLILETPSRRRVLPLTIIR